MWQKVKNNPNKFHFVAYCISFIAYGALLTGLGPLIPYLAEQQHVPQTQYSFLFFARAAGFVVGACLVKIVQKLLSFHNTLIVFSTLVFVSFALFSREESMTTQGIYVFAGSVFCAITEIVLNVALLTAHVGPDQQFYIQIGHGMFGVGGFFSPFVVLFFEQSTYFILGLMLLLVTPFYYYLQTPEKKKQAEAAQILQAGNLADQVVRIEHRISNMSQNRLQQKNNLIIYLISFMFFVYIGQQVAYGGWISSYAVLQGVSTKQHATVYSSIFWAFMTCFRFMFAFVNVKPSRKLKALIVAQLVLTLIVLVLVQYFRYLEFATYFASITYGISFSAMFGLFFVMPSEYGMEVTCEEGSSFLMYGQLGEGVISMMVGYLMSWITPTMIYYSVLLCGILLYFSCNKIINTLIKEQSHHSQQYQQQHQMTQLKTTNYPKLQLTNNASLDKKLLTSKGQI